MKNLLSIMAVLIVGCTSSEWRKEVSTLGAQVNQLRRENRDTRQMQSEQERQLHRLAQELRATTRRCEELAQWLQRKKVGVAPSPSVGVTTLSHECDGTVLAALGRIRAGMKHEAVTRILAGVSTKESRSLSAISSEGKSQIEIQGPCFRIVLSNGRVVSMQGQGFSRPSRIEHKKRNKRRR